jgi:hypothetical protein
MVSMVKRDVFGLIICPNCQKHFRPILGERKTDLCIQDEFPNAEPWEREQLLTGLCSNRCWNKYLGVER